VVSLPASEKRCASGNNDCAFSPESGPPIPPMEIQNDNDKIKSPAICAGLSQFRDD
jgi:hypothetical protein